MSLVCVIQTFAFCRIVKFQGILAPKMFVYSYDDLIGLLLILISYQVIIEISKRPCLCPAQVLASTVMFLCVVFSLSSSDQDFHA